MWPRLIPCFPDTESSSTLKVTDSTKESTGWEETDVYLLFSLGFNRAWKKEVLNKPPKVSLFKLLFELEHFVSKNILSHCTNFSEKPAGTFNSLFKETLLWAVNNHTSTITFTISHLTEAISPLCYISHRLLN